jgi:hypothetical protein
MEFLKKIFSNNPYPKHELDIEAIKIETGEDLRNLSEIDQKNVSKGWRDPKSYDSGDRAKDVPRNYGSSLKRKSDCKRRR